MSSLAFAIELTEESQEELEEGKGKSRGLHPATTEQRISNAKNYFPDKTRIGSLRRTHRVRRSLGLPT